MGTRMPKIMMKIRIVRWREAFSDWLIAVLRECCGFLFIRDIDNETKP